MRRERSGWDSCPGLKRPERLCLLFLFSTTGCHLQTCKGALARHGRCSTLILSVPASRTVRTKCLLKPAGLW